MKGTQIKEGRATYVYWDGDIFEGRISEHLDERQGRFIFGDGAVYR